MSDTNDDRFYAYKTSPSLEEVRAAISTLNRFYEVAPFGWGEIEHTVNALDEYQNRLT